MSEPIHQVKSEPIVEDVSTITNTVQEFYSATYTTIRDVCLFQGLPYFHDESSSDEASMGASLSPSSMGAPSSSLSSSLLLFTPCGPPSSPSTRFGPESAPFGAVDGTLGGRPAKAEGGALNIDCCSSVVVTSLFAVAGIRYVPSSFATVSDLPLAYWIF